MARSPVSTQAAAPLSTRGASSTRLSVLLACAGLALSAVTACGGSVEQPTGSGGSTSTGTTGTGLTTSTGVGGGTSTGVGGGTSTGTTTGVGGGTSTSTGVGGGTSTGTTTGVGGGAPTCPAAEPMSQTACGPIGSVCDYDLTQCVCYGNGWHCGVCPDVQPQANSACMSGGPGMGGGATCGYGDTYCHCGGGGPNGTTWHCGTCPAQAPASMTACDIPGVQCPYADPGVTCNCSGMGNWNCSLPCPPAQPQPGDACMGGMGGGMGGGGIQQCSYGNTTCICVQGQYFCN